MNGTITKAEADFAEEMSHCPVCGARVPLLMRLPLPWDYLPLRCSTCVRTSTHQPRTVH